MWGEWAASRSVAGVQKQGCQVLLVLEDPWVWSWFSAPCVWLPGTGKEQAGETEILIAGHVAHESTRKAAQKRDCWASKLEEKFGSQTRWRP